MDWHNKASDGPRRLAVYINDNFRQPSDLERTIYITGLLQAEALAAAVRGWRRHWGGQNQPAVGGALVWQLNDCWPVTSWAIADYYLRPKPAYYVLRRELAPLALGLAHAPGGADIWAVNGRLAPVSGELALNAWTLAGELVTSERRPVSLPPNQATEIGQFIAEAGAPLVFAARLLVEGQTVARAALWPEPFKYLALPDPGIELLPEGDTIRLRTSRPAKGVWLAGGDGLAWSDNLLDLLPGDEQIVSAPGLAPAEIQMEWLT
jgi:beta-mannosidase